MKDDGSLLHKWLCDLFPLSRSVVGPGIDQSLEYLANLMGTASEYLNYPSGTIVNGWKIPNAWKLNSARIEDLLGNVIVSTEQNNLHLWSHSAPFEGQVTREELENHLLTLKEIPEAIPYATTYYKENWGFSITYETYNSLTETAYRVFIDTLIYPDTLKILEVVIPGTSKSEILFSTYLCHPSMANNELSGPVLATSLARYLASRDNNYTYRFLFGPETIGPICYLSDHVEALKNTVVAAFNLTCVGGGDEWSLLQSPSGSTYSDKIALELFKSRRMEFKTYDFLSRGSDERQFCSPNVNLPMVSIMRSKYHEYREYHNSLDDCNFVSATRLQESLDFYIDLLTLIDADGVLRSKVLGEPFLTNYFDYPSVGGRVDNSERSDYRIASQLIAFANDVTLVDIADRIDYPVLKLLPILEKCVAFGLIDVKPLKPGRSSYADESI